MKRRLEAIAALALVAGGCYRPTVKSCRLTCAEGSCPDGLDCVTGYCVEHGFAGTCTGGAGDGGGQPAVDAAPATVTLTTYAGLMAIPALFVAGQDGDGAWQPLDSNDGTYTLDATTGRYGFVLVCQQPSLNLISANFVYATTADGTAVAWQCGEVAAGPSGILHVTSGDRPSAVTVNAWVGTSDLVTLDDNQPTGDVQLPVGTYDVVGLKMAGDAASNATALELRQGIVVTQGSTTSLDIELAQATAATPFDAALDGIDPSDQVTTDLDVVTPWTFGRVYSASGTTATALPGFALPDGAIHQLQTQATDNANRTERSVIRWFVDPADTVMQLPFPFGDAAWTLEQTSPYLRPHLVADAFVGDVTDYFGTVSESALGNPWHMLEWNATPAWMGGAATIEWTAPDLSGVAGWNDGWMPSSPSSWSAAAIDDSTGPAGVGPAPSLSDWDGRILTVAGRNGLFQ